jgi:DNA-binding NarL/FixJ family response regulator
MNGVDLLRQFRDILTPLRAVVITAYIDDRMVTQAEDLGAAVMPKPVNFGLLSRLVREVTA